MNPVLARNLKGKKPKNGGPLKTFHIEDGELIFPSMVSEVLNNLLIDFYIKLTFVWMVLVSQWEWPLGKYGSRIPKSEFE